VWNTVRNAMDDTSGNTHGKAFFLRGAGGSGKTFLYGLLLDHARSQGRIALAVASSGIAALLLEGGTTGHSRFKVPINITADSTCTISKQSALAQTIRDAAIIIWDEAPMMHRHIYEALDRTLRDIMNVQQPFGGKTIVLGGDFRQTLPIVPRGNQASITNATLKKSHLWNRLTQLELTENMRLDAMQGPEADEQRAWCEYLIRIGDGRESTRNNLRDNFVRFPAQISNTSNNPEDLIAAVYGDMINNPIPDELFVDNCIMTPLNKTVDQLNTIAMQRFPGDTRSYYSADMALDDDVTTYPTEFLNTLQPQGMPPHKLELKVGTPVMLMRNLNAKSGLANGTRLVILAMNNYTLQAKVLTGKNKGDIVLIPRIPLETSDDKMPVQFNRLQFPIRVAFAMTINKAQGQTMERVAIYLPSPVFGHGQLYVALSRVKQRNNLTIMVGHQWALQDPITGLCSANIVYRNVLL
jgi:ATP-dependent DNA helicase PIF1